VCTWSSECSKGGLNCIERNTNDNYWRIGLDRRFNGKKTNYYYYYYYYYYYSTIAIVNLNYREPDTEGLFFTFYF
jgi:hypothetical protein